MEKDTSDYNPLLQPDDTQLDHAVRLACAFIANGDIRLPPDKMDNTRTFAQLAHLIDGLYGMLDDAHGRVLQRVWRDGDEVMEEVKRRGQQP